MQPRSITPFAVKTVVIILLCFQIFSCKKAAVPQQISQQQVNTLESKVNNGKQVNFNLEVVLRGEGNSSGHIHFRQDADAAKIITLDIKVHHLKPNHMYFLQRAVDTNLDGNCTGSSWLTLGYGLQPHAIFTDDKGNGDDILWRDVSAIPNGATFDIHFQVIDAVTMEVVLSSDCYQYTVR